MKILIAFLMLVSVASAGILEDMDKRTPEQQKADNARIARQVDEISRAVAQRRAIEAQERAAFALEQIAREAKKIRIRKNQC